MMGRFNLSLKGPHRIAEVILRHHTVAFGTSFNSSRTAERS